MIPVFRSNEIVCFKDVYALFSGKTGAENEAIPGNLSTYYYPV
jgi:hypothetical protein